MNRLTRTAVFLLLAFPFTIRVSAQPVGGPGSGPVGPGPGGPGGPGGPSGPPVPIEQVLKDVLDFTDAQITSFRALADARRTAAETLQPRLGDAQKALGDALNATTPNATTVGTALLTVRDLQKQMQGIDDTFKNGVKALLTAAQKQKLTEIQAFRDLQRAAGALGAIGL